MLLSSYGCPASKISFLVLCFALKTTQKLHAVCHIVLHLSFCLCKTPVDRSMACWHKTTHSDSEVPYFPSCLSPLARHFQFGLDLEKLQKISISSCVHVTCEAWTGDLIWAKVESRMPSWKIKQYFRELCFPVVVSSIKFTDTPKTMMLSVTDYLFLEIQ